MLEAFTGTMTRDELLSTLRLEGRRSFSERYLRPAIAAGLVEMTIPDKPNSRLQRYRLTEAGKARLVTKRGGTPGAVEPAALRRRPAMKTTPKPQNDETTRWLTTLAERAKALDAIFACGGEVEVPAPLSLRGPGGKKLEVVEGDDFRRSKVDKKLLAWCAPASFGEGTETRTDARVREGRQLYARDGALAVDGFDEALREILSRVRDSLCPHDAAPPVAELHSLNVYGRGGHFVAHKDTPRDPSVFGTLVVCLPLSFSGGRLVVEQESRATFNWERESFFLTSRETQERRIRWAAFFSDVDHRIEMVTSGCRVTLTYELRRAPNAAPAAPDHPGAAEAAFSVALAEAIADPTFSSDGGTFGMPCLHLYALPMQESISPGVGNLRDHLKGRDRLVAVALERAGLVARVVPYVFETCAGDSWRLHRDPSARERQIFAQKRLKGSSLERRLPIEFHADWDQSDDVKWLVRPPWISKYREPADGRPEPEVALLGQTEYSATDYFGNEGSDVSFYAAAAILFDVPPTSARKRAGGN